MMPNVPNGMILHLIINNLQIDFSQNRERKSDGNVYLHLICLSGM